MRPDFNRPLKAPDGQGGSGGVEKSPRDRAQLATLRIVNGIEATDPNQTSSETSWNLERITTGYKTAYYLVPSAHDSSIQAVVLQFSSSSDAVYPHIFYKDQAGNSTPLDIYGHNALNKASFMDHMVNPSISDSQAATAQFVGDLERISQEIEDQGISIVNTRVVIGGGSTPERVGPRVRKLIEERREQTAPEISRSERSVGKTDIERINEILGREGVEEALSHLNAEFNSSKGESLFYGITPSGLVVGIRSGVNPDFNMPGFYKAWVLDAALPAERIEQEVIRAEFSGKALDMLRDGGTLKFPSLEVASTLNTYIDKSDDEIRVAFADNDPEGMVAYVKFARAIGGSFVYPTQLHGARNPVIGEQTLYQFNQDSGK